MVHAAVAPPLACPPVVSRGATGGVSLVAVAGGRGSTGPGSTGPAIYKLLLGKIVNFKIEIICHWNNFSG